MFAFITATRREYMIIIILDNNNSLLQFQLINIHIVSFVKYVLRRCYRHFKR